MIKTTCLFILCVILSCVARSQPCTIPDTLIAEDTIVVCAGVNFQLNGPAVTGATYTWSTTDATSSVMINRQGKYWLRMQQPTCERTDTVTILFNSFLLCPAVADLKLCKGQPALPMPVTGQQLKWYPSPMGGVASTVLPTISTADTGRATYWFTQTLKGCESPRIAMEVKVIEKPRFELGDAFIIPCGASGITLQVVPEEDTRYTWSNGSRNSSIMAPGRGRYWLLAENMCGSHRDTTIAVECKDKCVQFPTAFTPNSDGKNDKYRASCFCPVPKFSLAIYNRNGEQVFHTTNPEAYWDGYYKGKLQPNGAYVYFTEFFDFVLKRTFNERGSFVLLR